MSKNPIYKNYISEIDSVLQAFDKEHPELSKAQKKEQEKYAHIYYLRDVADRSSGEPI